MILPNVVKWRGQIMRYVRHHSDKPEPMVELAYIGPGQDNLHNVLVPVDSV